MTLSKKQVSALPSLPWLGAILPTFSNLASDCGITHPTARRWLTLLEASYIVDLLQPYSWNTTKRLVRSPKLYFYDVGLAAYLLGAQTPQHVASHPLRGSLFKNLVVMASSAQRRDADDVTITRLRCALGETGYNFQFITLEGSIRSITRC